MTQHKMECGKIVTTMPKPENAILQFKDYQKKIDVPFVIYADFECILEDTALNVSDETKFIQKHIPCAFSYFIKCKHNNKLDKLRVYTSIDASEKFVLFLNQDCKDSCNNHLAEIK